ncbi:MAG: hypothetical protein KDE26_29250 [Bacteroidetes bacterium]|nr:hypothetical protein [Bacteroidota bacterium]
MENYRLDLSVLCLAFLVIFQPKDGFSQVSDSLDGPEKVYTGIYLINIYDLDINEHSFYADCYIWFRWKGDRDPMNIEFVNAVDKWGATLTPFYEEPKQIEDGFWYNGMRYEGRFYHPFDLERFPLDKHLIDIQIENVDYPIDSMVYLADTNASFIREEFQIPGWDILGASSSSKGHHYPVDFGNVGQSNTDYSNITFLFSLRRPLNYFLLKLLLPLVIVILASLGALFIHPSSIDARISLPIGGLLSTVFLQQSYSSALPDVGYMVLMDDIYLLVYAMIAGIMFRVILVGNRVAREKKSADIQTIRKKDRRMAMILLGALSLGIVILVL